MIFDPEDFDDTLVAEMPDKQPPWPSEKQHDDAPPLNPNPIVPGADSPETNTGSRMDEDIPAQDIDEDDVGTIESQNP